MNTLAFLKQQNESLLAQIETRDVRILAGPTAERDLALAELDSARAMESQLSKEYTAAVASNPEIAALDKEIERMRLAATSPQKLAARLLGSQGHRPLALSTDANESIGAGKLKGSLIEQYNALGTDAERGAFMLKHKDKI